MTLIASRIRLAEIGKRIGLRALKDVSTVVKPETVMEWFRKLVAKKFDGSGKRNRSGSRRPKIDPEVESEALKMARENPSWGYDRIVGALRNLGYDISDRTVGNILKSNGVPPVPKRKSDIPWNEFIESQKSVLAACDFFTTEVVTPAGLISECLSRLIIFGENGLRHALKEYLTHYHEERNHQGLANAIPFQKERNNPGSLQGRIVCRKRLGGLLKFYCREAA